MKNKWTFFLVLVGIIMMSSMAVWAQTPAAAPAADTAVSKIAPGSYKIGVVNRKEIFDKYNKTKAEYQKLEVDVSSLQKDINDLSTKIDAAKKDYEARKDKMTDSEREELENKIKLDYQKYKNEFKSRQDQVDSKEMILVKKLFEEIDAAIAKVASEGGYHLILDGTPGATPAAPTPVCFYSPTVDVTQKVVDHLNSSVPAPPETAAPADAASDSKEKKKGKK